MNLMMFAGCPETITYSNGSLFVISNFQYERYVTQEEPIQIINYQMNSFLEIVYIEHVFFNISIYKKNPVFSKKKVFL